MKTFFLTLGLALAGICASQAVTGKLGDAAPALKIKDWVKGKPVDVTDGKNIYVVEFWATWCGPCKVSIPHLSEMQKTFKDKNVVFVGISDESADTVKPFVQKQGDQMGYTVACDDERSSNAKYMEAYGQNGIPHAFVIDKSAKVIWHGHPMDGLEEALKQIVAGKYDISTAKKKEMAKSDLSEYQLAAIRGDEKATDMGRKLLVAAGDDKDALCELAFSIVANMQNRHRDFKLANEALDKAQKIAGKKDPQIMAVRSIGLFESGSHEEAVKMIKEAIDLSKDSAAQQANYNNFLRIMQMRVDSEKKAATKSEETPDKK